MRKKLTLLALVLLLTSCNKTEPETTWEGLNATNDHPLYHATVSNPTTGAELSTYLELPNDSGQSFPTVVLVPGGTGAATEAFKDNPMVTKYLENDIAIVYFDPDGRGESTGTDGANGYNQQDGLLAVSLFVAENPNVDSSKMGLVSYSYGVAMASGMLARHADKQPFIWYIDWEGPVSREYVTVGCEENPDPQKSYTKCSDDAFWSEREAVTFFPDIEIPYQRLQGAEDHVQSSNKHAIDAINAATNGKSSWTRINTEDPNQTFTYENPPSYFPQKNQSMQASPDFAKDLFDLFD